MIRINAIIDLIDKCDLVIDIGSDHAYTAITLLSNQKASFVVNVEKHSEPLKQGIDNLTKQNLLNSTMNILNDGLNKIDTQLPIHVFDYGVISGLGAKTIIQILETNPLVINSFVLQPNNNEHLLRKWLLTNGYQIITERVITENNISYLIIKTTKNRNLLYYSNSSLFLGHKKTVIADYHYYMYLINKLTYLQKTQDNYHIHKFTHEISFLTKRIKWYKQKHSMNN